MPDLQQKQEQKQTTKINFSSDAFKKYFKNTSWLFTEKIARLTLGFFVSIYMIRYLGPVSFGNLSYALSLTGLFTAFASLGLDSIVARELVKEPLRRDEILGTVFNLRVFGGFAALIMLGTTILFTGDDAATMLLIAVIGLSLIVQAFFVIEFYFQSIVQIKYTALVQITNLVICGICKIVLIQLQAPVIWFAFSYLLEAIISSAGFVYVYNKTNLKLRNWYFRRNAAIALIKDSWPLIFSGLVIAIYMKIDQVLIKKILSQQETGLYAAAVKLCEAWYFIPLAVSASLFPAIMSAKSANRELFLSRLQKLYDILVWIAILIAIPVSLFAKNIMIILFGVKYLGAVNTLTIYIWAGVPTFLGVASTQYLIAENLTRILFYRTLAGMIMNVVLNILLIPIYGIDGSAFATLVSYSIATFSIAASAKTFFQLKMFLKAMLFIDFFSFIFKLWQKRSRQK